MYPHEPANTKQFSIL